MEIQKEHFLGTVEKALEAFTQKEQKLENGKLIWEMPAYGSAVFIVKQG